MERDIDLKEISDGRLYTANDMVKIGCNDCAGCSECCRVVEDTILLDPYDIYQLTCGTGMDFNQLMEGSIALQVVEGMIQPNLNIRQDGEGCVFLSEEGRCTIHGYRPGFCRMFPMGRIYEENGFKYFLQVHECTYPNKTKIKLKKWLGISELSAYEEYINRWHDLTKEVKEILKSTENDTIIKNLNMYLLNLFYVKPYDVIRGENDFSRFKRQFEERLDEAKQTVKMYS